MVTADELDALRPRLRAFCYQMLGSPFDAEDAVQDVLERAWRSRDRYDEARASLSTWCFAIARNVCVDRLRDAGRRPLPRDLQAPGIEVGAPFVAATDVPWLMPAPSGWARGSVVEDGAERSDEVRFAVTAMLQSLPATQRAVFTLREVLRFTAADTATALGTSVPAVNSALQRARSGLRTAGPVGGAAVERAHVERYAAALERGDVQGLVALVADDVVLEMPPVPAWSRGVEQYRDFMAYVFDWRGRDWATRALVSEHQSALLLYRVEDGVPRPHSVQLLGADATGRIDHVLVYPDPQLFALFERMSDEFSGDRS
ncbi:RNA polymerase subunit sigma-70 [Cellulomonas sp. JH27-2]|uniref:RNA polymerase subunit sigma-70 n=1 Tax=Cellulomonas sp. JH27-2 TaxID=2774139 RepID=UPI00177F4C76|nr:RNA polymerase subunit sigma-70 [Cellulomonas sp. JH27-2]